MVSYRSLLREAELLLQPSEQEAAAFTARELLSYRSGLTLAQLLSAGSAPVPEELVQLVQADVKEIVAGRPLAHILGEWSFHGLDLKVTPDTLIPRDDTEAVAELALEALRGMSGPAVLDLCTGTGCIGLALAKELPLARVTLADISVAALRVAKENIERCGLCARVSATETDVLQPYSGTPARYDLITANPPYITADEMKKLPASVGAYEPVMALYGGEDGLDFYRAIAVNYYDALKPGGCLCLEFGMGQEKAVCAILQQAHYEVVKLKKDIHDITRAVIARTERKEA